MSDSDLTLHYNFAVDQSLVARIGPTLGIVRLDPATFFNSSGLIETVQTDVARFEYDPVTRISLGLLVEEKRTNDCLHNRDGTNAVWVKLNMTAAKDQIGEDGVANSATSLLATAGNATAIQAFTIGSTAQTGTFSIKRLIGTGNVDITIDDGVTFTTVNINSLTYTRFAVTQTLANPDIGVRLVTSGDKIAIDFQGLEAGAFPTSRIATTTVAITRDPDVINSSDVSWFNAPTGSLYVDMIVGHTIDVAGQNVGLSIDDGGFNNAAVLRHTDPNQPGLIVRAATSTVAAINNTVAVGTRVKIAGAYAVNDFVVTANGLAVATDNTGAVPSGINAFRLGIRGDGGGQLSGHIAEIRYYNVRKDNTFLESLSGGIINEDSINLSTNLARPIVRKIARPH